MHLAACYSKQGILRIYYNHNSHWSKVEEKNKRKYLETLRHENLKTKTVLEYLGGSKGLNDIGDSN